MDRRQGALKNARRRRQPADGQVPRGRTDGTDYTDPQRGPFFSPLRFVERDEMDVPCSVGGCWRRQFLARLAIPRDSRPEFEIESSRVGIESRFQSPASLGIGVIVCRVQGCLIAVVFFSMGPLARPCVRVALRASLHQFSDLEKLTIRNLLLSCLLGYVQNIYVQKGSDSSCLSNSGNNSSSSTTSSSPSSSTASSSTVAAASSTTASSQASSAASSSSSSSSAASSSS